MLSTKQFDWDPKTQTFTAEVSSLGPRPFEQVYPDAADMGFTLLNPKTGKSVTFVQVSESRVDFELLDWTFRPIAKDVLANPRLAHVKAVVFND